MDRIRAIALGTLLAATALAADSNCPAVAFDTGTVLNLKASETSHTFLVRQSDGSYTAYEVADSAPYAVLGASPNYPAGLSECPFPANTNLTNVKTAAVSLRLPSGLIVLAGPYQSFSSVQVRVFDSQFRFVSETLYLQRDQTDSVASSGVLPQWIEATDIDGDGNADLVVAGTISVSGGGTRAGVFLLLGDSAGGFRAGNHYDVWNQSYVHMTGLAIADLNQDGIPDLLAAAEDMDGLTGTLFVLLGSGNGAFEEPRTVIKVPRFWKSDTRGVPSVAAHDLNGDGVPDLVFSERTALHVALGVGDGTFSETPSLAPVDHPVSIGDVDGDGNPDIVSGGTVLFGDGAGNFPDRRQYLAPVEGRTILTDWNADGKPDIVVGMGSADVVMGNQVAILAGREGRNLAASPGVPFPDAITAAVAADFNRDGVPDLAVASGELVHILTAAPDGSLSDVAQYTLPIVMTVCQPTALVPADFNGDGVMDLAAAFRCQPRGSYLVVYRGKGDGTLGRKPEILETDPYTQSIGAGDFNGDGIADLVAVNGQPSDSLELFEASGGGKFLPPRRYSVGPGAKALAIGDFNGDGRLDVMVSNPGYDTVPNGGLILLAGNGDGTLGEPAFISMAADRFVTGDFDGNGTLDLATLTNQTARVALGRGDGSFDEAVDYGIFSRSALAADLDGDGAVDLVAAEGSVFGVMSGKGDGSFRPPYLGDSLTVLAVTDFNGDGRPDLVGWRSGMLYAFVQAVPTASTVSK